MALRILTTLVAETLTEWPDACRNAYAVLQAMHAEDVSTVEAVGDGTYEACGTLPTGERVAVSLAPCYT